MKALLSSLPVIILVALLANAWIAVISPYLKDRKPTIEDPPIRLSWGDAASTTIHDQDGEDQTAATTISPGDVFSETYQQARDRFTAAVQSLEEPFRQHVERHYPFIQDLLSFHSLPVYIDATTEQTYTTDIVVIPGTVPGMVVHTSGVHGVEGYAGSAIQIAFLRLLRNAFSNSSSNNAQRLDFPTLVLIHVINPYGMARFRRVDQNNVDLNRNALPDDVWNSSYVMNHSNKADYDHFDPLFNPREAPTAWSATVGYIQRAALAIYKYGLPRLKQAMVRGQYHDATGLVFGGTQGLQPSWDLLRQWWHKQNWSSILTTVSSRSDGDEDGKSNASPALTWVDVHTGLGPFGKDTLLAMGSSSTTNLTAHLAQYFPNSLIPGSSTAGSSVAQGYETVRGTCDDFVQTVLFANDNTAPATEPQQTQRPLVVTQEFGTLATVWVGRGLILENAAYHHLSPAQALQWANRTTTRPAFYPQSRTWRRRILEAGVRVLQQAMHRSMEMSTSTQ